MAKAKLITQTEIRSSLKNPDRKIRDEVLIALRINDPWIFRPESPAMLNLA
jgi:hypothetical protein